MDDFCIMREHPRLIEYVDHLQRKNVLALSFYPRAVFEREAALGRLFLGVLNNEPCGYIYVGAPGGDLKCHQACIQYDARRKLYGATLVAAMEKFAEEGHSASISLRCAFDLEANDFWREMGYGVIAIRDGGIRRQRKLNVWRKQIRPELFETIYIEPAVGQIDATLWQKHRQTGLVSQFTRGKRLSQYRNYLLTKAEDLP